MVAATAAASHLRFNEHRIAALRSLQADATVATGAGQTSPVSYEAEEAAQVMSQVRWVPVHKSSRIISS